MGAWQKAIFFSEKNTSNFFKNIEILKKEYNIKTTSWIIEHIVNMAVREIEANPKLKKFEDYYNLKEKDELIDLLLLQEEKKLKI